MEKPRNASLNVVFSPDAWQTLGRVSSEEFQTLQTALRAELAAEPSGEAGRRAGEVRSGHLVATYEVDPERGAVTVLALARTSRLHSSDDFPSGPRRDSSEL